MVNCDVIHAQLAPTSVLISNVFDLTAGREIAHTCFIPNGPIAGFVIGFVAEIVISYVSSSVFECS